MTMVETPSRLLSFLLGLLLLLFGVGGGSWSEYEESATPAVVEEAVAPAKLLLVLQLQDGGDADALATAAQTVQDRIESLGFTGVEVWTSGQDQIVAEIPDAGASVIDGITAALTTAVPPVRLEIIDPQGEFLAAGTVVRTTLDQPEEGATPVAGTVYETIVSGADVKQATATFNQLGMKTVSFQLTDEAAERFLAYTTGHIGQPLSIVVDKGVVSSPVLNSPISNEVIIDGLPEDEVDPLVDQLNSGVGAAAVTVVATYVLDPISVSTPGVAIDDTDDSGCWTADQVISTDPMQWSAPPAMTLDLTKSYTATFATNLGTFIVELLPGHAPVTVNNFVCLARAGYYDNTVFHRIIAGFVIQGGDPTATGRGGPGYRFDDEPIERDYQLGTVAMANAGPNTNGSQFFIVVGDAGVSLPKNYTIFGQVLVGMDVVDHIAAVPVTQSDAGEQSRSVDPVVIGTITIGEA